MTNVRSSVLGDANKKLFSFRDLFEPSVLMNSLQFLAEAHFFGIAIHPWKIVGLSGSLVFGLRFLIQWIASERARKSVIPFGFWECSALGSLLMLSYFASYQRDSVGVLSTAMPLPIAISPSNGSNKSPCSIRSLPTSNHSSARKITPML